MIQANKTPNPADFSSDENPREYKARIRVEGEIIVTIMADSEGEATQKAEEIADNIAEDVTECELDEVDDVRVSYVWKSKPMYRVMRDGKAMKVSHLRHGDLPREPDERGF